MALVIYQRIPRCCSRYRCSLPCCPCGFSVTSVSSVTETKNTTMTAPSPPSADNPAAMPSLKHLRPTTPMEMMDRAFDLLRIRPGLFLALGAAYGVVNTLALSLVLNGMYKQKVLEMTPWKIVLDVLSLWPFAALVASAFQTLIFPRRPLRMWVALRGTFGRLPYLILTMFLMQIIFDGLAILPQVFLESGAGDNMGAILYSFATFAAMGLALYFSISWGLVPVAVMVERRGFFDALRRSAQLMRLRYSRGLLGDGAFRRFGQLALFPAALLGVGLAGLGCLIEIFSVGGVGNVAGPPPLAVQVPFILGTFAISMIYAPWVASASVLLYAESRMRSEALDFQVRLMSGDASEIADLRAQVTD